MTNHRRRMQVRRLRTGGWDPVEHNESVRMMKALRRATQALTALQRSFMRWGRRAQ